MILSGLSYRLSFWNLTRACELPSLVVCLMQASSLLYVRPIQELHDPSQARDTRSLCLSFVTGARPMTVGMALKLVGIRNSGDNKHTHTHTNAHMYMHTALDIEVLLCLTGKHFTPVMIQFWDIESCVIPYVRRRFLVAPADSSLNFAPCSFSLC